MRATRVVTAGLACMIASVAAAQDGTFSSRQDQSARKELRQVTTADAFVADAAMMNLFEITSSRDALERADDPVVRALARRLVDDHTRMGRALAMAADSAGVTGRMPFGEGALDNYHRGLLKQLLNGAYGYDATFAEMQIHVHQDAVALYGSFAERGDNEELKAFAQENLPHLHEHIRLAEEAHQSATTGTQ